MLAQRNDNKLNQLLTSNKKEKEANMQIFDARQNPARLGFNLAMRVGWGPKWLKEGFFIAYMFRFSDFFFFPFSHPPPSADGNKDQCLSETFKIQSDVS